MNTDGWVPLTSRKKKSRGVALTEKGLRAIGIVPVPLLDLPWRQEQEREDRQMRLVREGEGGGTTGK